MRSINNPLGRNGRIISIIAPLVPYITIGIGLLWIKNVWAAMLGYHLCMLLIIAVSGKNIPVKNLLRSDNRLVTVFNSIMGLCGGVSLYICWSFLNLSNEIGSYLLNIGLDNIGWIVFIVYFCLVNPWLEEYYWRGYLNGGSRKFEVNDILFAGYHVLVLFGLIGTIWVAAVFVILIFAAWIWRQSNRLSGGLLTSVLSHLFADISVILIIYLMTSMV